MDARKILHLDLDAFFCAVEELRQPELRGKAFAVGGKPNERGVVASCSYPARQHGVHSAMPMSQAVRLLPGLLIISQNFGAYREASHNVMAILGRLTPLVEQLSIDEAFLDVSDLPGDPAQIARRLQAQILAETGLPCSIGVAANKLVAKMATDYGKSSNRTGSYPNAIHVVPPGGEQEFLAGLPTKALWGVGPKTEARLAQMGIHTIADLAAVPESVMRGWFGKSGTDLWRHARGIDDRAVVVEHITKSVSQEITFDRDSGERGFLEETLRSLSEQLAYSLRQDRISGATVRLKLRWSDFSTHTRQITLPTPTNQDDVIYHVALGLFNNLWTRGRMVRLLGVGVSGLTTQARQLALWDSGADKERRLLEALDTLRARFGDKIVRRGG